MKSVIISSLALLVAFGIGFGSVDQRLEFDTTGKSSCNQALERAWKSHAGPDTLRLPAGRFLFDPILLPSGKVLIGRGTGTIFLPSSKANANAAFITFAGPGTLRSFQVEGAGRSFSPTIAIGKNASGIFIDSLFFNRIGGTVIRTDNAGSGLGDFLKPDVEIRNCKFTNPATAIELAFSKNIRIIGNEILDADRSGILFWGASVNPQKRADRMEEDVRCRNLEIIGNIIKDARPIVWTKNTKEGIWGVGGVDLLIAENRVEVAEDVGIDMEWCDRVVIRQNHVSGGRNGGIAIFYSSRDILIEGNSVVNDYPDFEKHPDGTVKGERASILLSKTTPNIPACDTAYNCGHRNVTIVGNQLIHKADRERRSIYTQVRDHPGCQGCPPIHEIQNIRIAFNLISIDTAGVLDRSTKLLEGNLALDRENMQPLDDSVLKTLYPLRSRKDSLIKQSTTAAQDMDTAQKP